MTKTDYQLMEFYRDTVAQRPQKKFEETITSWDRDVFLYDRDELSRQADHAETNDFGKITYEDHRRAIETTVNMLRKDTQHSIAMTILTHRFFKDYRAKAFAGEGSFRTDYTFLIKKIGMMFNPDTKRVNTINLVSSLQAFKKPTLVQINHITGDVKAINPPSTKFTLNEWAQRYNVGAPESTSYRLVGLTIG